MYVAVVLSPPPQRFRSAPQAKRAQKTAPAPAKPIFAQRMGRILIERCFSFKVEQGTKRTRTDCLLSALHRREALIAEDSLSVRERAAAALAALLRAEIELRGTDVAIDPFAAGKLSATALASLLQQAQPELPSRRPAAHRVSGPRVVGTGERC